MHALLLIPALLLDALLGEPKWLWDHWPHPAVLMGRAVDRLDRWMNRGRRRLNGVITVALLVAAAWALGALLAAVPLIGPVLEVLGAAILLAQRSLAEHVRAVATGLRQGLPEGRRMVARIVGRDTAAMDESSVARAAIESAAENFSDGVIAPAFWFLIGGLPGILIYKVVNTADSMIGHRTPRHEEFGWAAARLDDLLNLVPARLTAVLIAVFGWRRGMARVVLRDAPRHRSPNAGWPEAAVAVALGIAVSGPRSYGGQWTDQPFVNPDGRHDIGADEIDDCVRLLWGGWVTWLGLVAVPALIFA